MTSSVVDSLTQECYLVEAPAGFSALFAHTLGAKGNRFSFCTFSEEIKKEPSFPSVFMCTHTHTLVCMYIHMYTCICVQRSFHRLLELILVIFTPESTLKSGEELS